MSIKFCSAHLKVKYDALYSTSRWLPRYSFGKPVGVESFHTYRCAVWWWNAGTQGRTAGGAVEAVKKDKADLGLATDGDSDRFGIVDEQGNV